MDRARRVGGGRGEGLKEGPGSVLEMEERSVALAPTPPLAEP